MYTKENLMLDLNKYNVAKKAEFHGEEIKITATRLVTIDKSIKYDFFITFNDGNIKKISENEFIKIYNEMK